MARPVRWLPWVLSIITAVVVLAASPATGAGSGGRSGVEVRSARLEGALSAAPTPGPPAGVCGDLYALSEQAAALTGSLALVGPEERPAQAREAAAQIRGLAVQAAGMRAGGDLAGVLEDLADALERYAGGDPASPAAVREASASNARLRAAYAACANPTSGGE